MNEPPTKPSLSDEPVLSVIARIKDKRLDPGSLSSEDRRRCVEVLRGEGYSVAEIAQILGKNERTIYRDIDHLRREHALVIDPGFALRVVGDLMHHAEGCVSRVQRIARESGASAMERAIAESTAWKIKKELVERLQSLGYLPQVNYANGVDGVPLAPSSIPTLAVIEQEAHEFKRRLLDLRPDAAPMPQLESLLHEVDRCKLAENLRSIRESAAPPEPQES